MKKRIRLKKKKNIKWTLIILVLLITFIISLASKQIRKSAQIYIEAKTKEIVSKEITLTIKDYLPKENIFKIEKDGFNLFIYYDSQLYANELADSVDRANKKNEACDKKLLAEEKRRNKGKGRLSDEELEKLQPIDLKEILAETPEMGTVTLRTNRLDLNSHQIYRTYKQRQSIEQFFKTYGESLDLEASYMREQISQEAWLF